MYFFECQEETVLYLIAKMRRRMYSRGGNWTDERQNLRTEKSDTE